MSESSSISRRNFIAAAGLASLGAVGLAACAPQGNSSDDGALASTAGSGAPSEWTYETDICVVGAGGAGLVAACRAKELGSEVILLEKMDRVGGDTALSSQTAQGFWTGHTEEADTVECYKEDLLASHWATEKGQLGIELPTKTPLTDAWLANCDDMYNWTQDLGMDWQGHVTPCKAWYPQPQWDRYDARAWVPGNGSIISVMQKAADDFGVDIKTGTAAISLIVDETGRVTGLYALEDETPVSIKTNKGVLLACGGFNANRAMMAKYLPIQGAGFCGGSNGNTGDGQVMAAAIGGKLVDMDLSTHWMVYDSAADTTFYLAACSAYGGNNETHPESSDYPFILVNYNGERYGAETMGYKYVGHYTSSQPYHMGYMVFDSGDICNAWFNSCLAAFGVDEVGSGAGYGDLSKMRIAEGETLEELARMIQVDAEALKATVERYNGFVDNGVDEDFDRSMRNVSRLETGPFRAVRMQPRHYTTYGGVAIDADGHVLDMSDQPIPGLYAAGTVCGSPVEQEGIYYQGGVGISMVQGFYMAKNLHEEIVTEA